MPRIKKKIVFFLSSFVVGGVERSFLDLLDNIDRNNYDITVYLPDDKGDWVSLLEEKCTVRYLSIQRFKEIFISQIRKNHFVEATKRLFFRVLCRWYFKRNYLKSREYLIRSMPARKEEYDCAVVYQALSVDGVVECLYRTKAKKKVLWSHGLNRSGAIYENWYGKFDKILCVSKFVQENFISNFPGLATKTDVIHNVINVNRILSLAEERSCEIEKSNGIILVTVGRLSKEKGQMLIPKAARLLVESGFDIKWYLVGDGSIRMDVEREIEKEGVRNNVILLGSKDNPYVYIKACDIYVQTSYDEGWGLTVTEAKVLCKPIVTTDANVMTEQIESGVNGIIVNECTSEALALGIGNLLMAPKIQESFIHKLEAEKVKYNEDVLKFLTYV